MKLKNRLTEQLGIDFPMIMAPMFLVSNVAMVTAAMRSGIMGAFPTLNCRTSGELSQWLTQINEARTANGSYGVNLIVQETNPYYREHLKICIAHKVPFFITSLGKPKEVIEQAHAYGAKVFCDVTNLEHAEKCYEQGCDGFIAVGQGAGGHAGPFPLHILIQSLKEKFPGVTVVAAGGIATGSAILSVMAAGADGTSVGTRFIASTEAPVSADYKNAIVESGMDDIRLTTKISGTPCTIIRTDYSDKIGYEQNFIERFLAKNKKTRRLFLSLVQKQGFDRLQAAIVPATYKTLWCAGQSVEMIHDIMPCEEIVKKLKEDFFIARKNFNDQFVS